MSEQTASHFEKASVKTFFPHRYGITEPLDEDSGQSEQSGDNIEEDIIIDSIIHTEYGCLEPYSIYQSMFSRTSENDFTVFSPRSDTDSILWCKLGFNLPKLRVKEHCKDDYRIFWCKNIGHNVIRNSHIKCDEIEIPGFDNVWLDNNMHSFVMKDKRDSYILDIGNKDYLTTPNNFLPEETILFEQPWSYYRRVACQFPLFLLDDSSKFKHIYEFERDIDNFLTLEKLDDDGIWKPIKVSKKYILGLPSDGELTGFNLYGKFGNLSDEDKDRYRCNEDGSIFPFPSSIFEYLSNTQASPEALLN